MHIAAWAIGAAALVSSSLGAPAPLAAQQASPAGCTYDRCALWLDRTRILRGMPGQRVGRLGVIGATRIEPLVAGSDSAQPHAREFDRLYSSGARITLPAAVAGGILLALAQHGASDGEIGLRDRQLLGASVVMYGITLYGQHRMNRAVTELLRALWWYNRDLPRVSGQPGG